MGNCRCHGAGTIDIIWGTKYKLSRCQDYSCHGELYITVVTNYSYHGNHRCHGARSRDVAGTYRWHGAQTRGVKGNYSRQGVELSWDSTRNG